MLLAGIAINALAQAFSGFLTFYATDTQIRSLTFWKLGSLGGGNWSSVLAILPFIIIPIVFFHGSRVRSMLCCSVNPKPDISDSIFQKLKN